ncbi:hypothetical protein COLO4_32423 [Corchorus olitorius]|uniref:Protein kinase domain-containing protein n=1 Tax=Corchorus olitorius TaxID=93759 RepID=A0A1R3GZG1_9ROSI|nr:hypothetical protein COLO4_32423 [Corchorus olitorius]
MSLLFLTIAIFFHLIPPFTKALTFNFTGFNTNDNNITYEKSAYPANQVIQLTTNQRDVLMTASIGRATYHKPMQLYDKASGNLTDFTTHFTFVIDSQNRTAYGDGIAFFLAPEGSKIPENVTKGGPNLNSNRRRKNRTGLAVGLGVAGALVGGAVLVWLATLYRKKFGKDEENGPVIDEEIEDEFERGTGPRKFTYKELSLATDNFKDVGKLGQGGFGGVYKGFLKDSNSYVAIKRVSSGSKQGIKEYASEVKIISRLRHRNLVQLIGWCHDKKELLLVYEYMPNGSLDSHLFKENSLLTWEFRINGALRVETKPSKGLWLLDQMGLREPVATEPEVWV